MCFIGEYDMERVSILRLNREDSMNLINSLYHPTLEQIDADNCLREKRNRDINIKQTETGFEAEITGLEEEEIIDTTPQSLLDNVAQWDRAIEKKGYVN